MPQQYSDFDTVNPTPDAQRILSDEEIQARAAAVAQKVYEQQLAALRLYRAQLMTAQRAQAEYAEQLKAYEQATRDIYASGPGDVVRVDPDTGEQSYAFQQQYAQMQAEQQYAQWQQTPQENFVPEENFSSEENPVAATESTENFPAETASQADATETFSEEETVAVESPTENDAPAPEAAPVRVLATHAPARNHRVFPILLVLFILILVVDLVAIAYVAFVDTPRNEFYREKFRALFVEKSETVAPAPAPVEEKTEAAPLVPDDPRPIREEIFDDEEIVSDENSSYESADEEISDDEEISENSSDENSDEEFED